MGAQVVDYRVSTLVVLCKDCGHDVGLYPARHKCQPIDRPAMPALPAQYTKSPTVPPSLDLNSRAMSSGSNSSKASSPSPSFSSIEGPSVNKWSSSRLNSNKSNIAVDDHEESVYFNNFAANLPGSSNMESSAAGKKLWGKVRQNEKWKQLSEKNDKTKPSGKLWGKLIQATQTMADKIPSKDDRSAESDEDDWEGETHVSRILREYYEKKRMRLPTWLFDDDVDMKRQPSSRRNREPLAALDSEEPHSNPVRTPSRRRLWEQNPDDPKHVSSRERERQELRQTPIKQLPQEDRYHNEYRDENGRYSGGGNHYGRDEDRYNQRPREEDRYNHRNYREEDRYYNNDNYYEPQKRNSRDQPRYEEDRYAQPRARSPPRSQRSNSTSRQARYYQEEDDRSYYQVPPRSARGYVDRHEDNNRADLNDYYYNNDNARHIPAASRDRAARYHAPPSEASRPIQSGGRRYGNDPGYF